MQLASYSPDQRMDVETLPTKEDPNVPEPLGDLGLKAVRTLGTE